MTSALALGQPARPVPPVLPDASLTVPVVDEEVVVNALTGTFDESFASVPPNGNAMPVEETTPPRQGHSGAWRPAPDSHQGWGRRIR